MSRISPQQRAQNNNNNLSVEFSRSGSGLLEEGEEEQVRINLQAGPEHDYLHPLNDLNQYNRVVSQVAQARLSPDYNYNSHNLNRNRNSWGSTLPNQCLDNMQR